MDGLSPGGPDLGHGERDGDAGDEDGVKHGQHDQQAPKAPLL